MTFERWLQMRLNAHGSDLAEDTSIGVATRTAIRDFQSRLLLPVTGLADAATVEALRKEPGRREQRPVRVPDQHMPPWLSEMTRRVGLHERRDKSALIRFLRIGRYLGDPAKLPWCGDAVESCQIKTVDEPVPSNPFWAQAWKDYGIDAGGPICGAIGVIRWNSGSGHVGYVVGYDPVTRRVCLRGGNQSNSIKDAWFDLDVFIAFRWPKTVPITHYPYLVGPKSSSLTLSSFGATR